MFLVRNAAPGAEPCSQELTVLLLSDVNLDQRWEKLRSGTKGLGRSCQAALVSIKYVTQIHLDSSLGLPAFSLSEPLLGKMKSRSISSFMVIYSAVRHEPG